ncbi:hypothetical protein HY641_04765 [Candidatus Woesearchaeota archaeon]|nr:hypothetical protein [Candidatus Woesearchaeota archaeon]
MADQTIDGKIKVQDNSPERVAYDLMEEISQIEGKMKQDRDYYLNLFHECHLAVLGLDLKSIVERRKLS